MPTVLHAVALKNLAEAKAALGGHSLGIIRTLRTGIESAIPPFFLMNLAPTFIISLLWSIQRGRANMITPIRHSSLFMTCIKGYLGTLCEEIESELSKNPAVLMRSSSMFPQKWVFRTEDESYTVTVNRTGQAHVRDGEGIKPDVIVEGSHELLASLLQSRSGSLGAPKVEAFTKKGQFGYGIIRKRVGL